MNYFDKKLIPYRIDKSYPAFGIPREDFDFIERASVLGSCIYAAKGKPVFELLEYVVDGNYYNYEDEDIIFYSPTMVTQFSDCFVIVKPFPFFENENMIVHLEFNIFVVKEVITSIGFNITLKSSNTKYSGLFITPNGLEDILARTQETVTQGLILYPWRFIVVKVITSQDLLFYFDFFNKTDEWMANYLYKQNTR